MSSPAQKLAALLSQTSLRPSVDPSRITQPSQYDLEYNAGVTACAMFALGARSEADARPELRINSTILKFGHFLAVRPALLADFKAWLERRGRRSDVILAWPLLPRGYLSDETQSAAVAYFVAIRALYRQGKDTVLPVSESNPLIAMHRAIEAAGLFVAERNVLSELRRVRLTQVMLGVA